MLLRVAGVLLPTVGALAVVLVPKPWPPALTLAVAALLVIVAAVQLAVLPAEKKAALRAAYAGMLESRVNAGAFPELEFGDSGSILRYAGPQGKPLLSIFEDCHLTIEILQNRLTRRRRLVVSTHVRDRRGHLVAEVVRNEWRVNPNVSFDRNFRAEAIEVRDSGGDVVLQARLIGERVQFQGKFYGANGAGVAIGKGIDATGTVGGIMEFTGANHPVLQAKFPPIFRYPSSRHHGEYIRA